MGLRAMAYHCRCCWSHASSQLAEDGVWCVVLHSAKPVPSNSPQFWPKIAHSSSYNHSHAAYQLKHGVSSLLNVPSALLWYCRECIFRQRLYNICSRFCSFRLCGVAPNLAETSWGRGSDVGSDLMGAREQVASAGQAEKPSNALPLLKARH